MKKVFLEISQNSQGNTCARVHSFFSLYALYLKEQDHIPFEDNVAPNRNNLFDLHGRSIEWGSIIW